jgi:rhomboid protease GluP
MSMSSLLGLAFVLAFARVVLASKGGFSDLFGFDARLLFVHGGNLAPALEAGDYWRLLTASFLHGGIIHLGFNLFALAVVGPQVEALYGRLQMLFLFVATGVVAFAGSAWAGPPIVAIGASGGLMGLVGVAAGWGHREGTGQGRAIRNDMLKWSAYVFVFGFFIQADNWAHLFGLLGGLAFGYSVRPRAWKLRELVPLRAATAAAGIVATVIALVMIARPAITLAELDAPARYQPNPQLQSYLEICRPHWQGDEAGAIARAKEMRVAAAPDEVRGLCDQLVQLREACRRGDAPPPDVAGGGGDALQDWRDFCDASEQLFGPAPTPAK